MKLRIPHKLPSAMYLIILICFALPFVAFSCGVGEPPPVPVQEGNEAQTVKESPNVQKTKKEDMIEIRGYVLIYALIGETIGGKIDEDELLEILSNYLAVVSFICALTCFILSFRKIYKTVAMIVLSAIGAASLMIWRFALFYWKEARIGIYAVTILFIAATILNAYYYAKEKKRPAADVNPLKPPDE